MIEIAGYKCVGRLPMKAELVSLVTSGKKTQTRRSCPKGIDPGGEAPYWPVGGVLWWQATSTPDWVTVKRRLYRDDYVYMQEPIRKGASDGIGHCVWYVSDDTMALSAKTGLPIVWHWKPDKLPGMNTGG